MKKGTVNFCTGNFKVILIVLLLFGIVVPLFIQILLLMQPGNAKEELMLNSHSVLYVDIEKKRFQVETLELHLDELEDIRIKTSNELLRLDEQRARLQDSIRELKVEKNTLEKEIRSYKKEAERVLKQNAEMNIERRPEKIIKNIIHVGVPKPHSSRDRVDDIQATNTTLPSKQCSYRTCIDFSRCSIIKPFSFHVYKPSSTSTLNTWYSTLIQHQDYLISNQEPCFYVILLSFDEQDSSSANNYLKSLPSWRRSSVNHVIFVENSAVKDICKCVRSLSYDKSILVLPKSCDFYDDTFDFLVPAILPDSNTNYWKTAPPLLPAKREYLAMFYSEFTRSNKNVELIEDLTELKSQAHYLIEMNCKGKFLHDCNEGWCPCSSERGNRLKMSTFNIILINKHAKYFFTELVETLKTGAIPLLLGNTKLLPYSNILDWSQACVLLHSQRFSELQYVLQTMPLSDLVALKRQGRMFYETYFSSKQVVSKTVLAALRHNIGFPPANGKEVKTEYINTISHSSSKEFLGAQISSPTFNHNFSYIGKNRHRFWNSYPGGLEMYPVTIMDQPIPSEVQFSDEGKDFYLPIGDGKGGDGVAFSRSLGGDYPNEQFTVLMLTYDRPGILIEALQRLAGMKYLNKVIVLWNHPNDPSHEISWPDIGVRIEVVRTGRNSLNNRFIPYDAIKTEAILSVDDDVYLRHDEIELAFRVWRENRDRLVGFPGRHHSYNSTTNSFYYNPEHACELSLILTGAAFFHKYYSYVYTYNVNPAIRRLVDEYMNCEDIAINFLIAHITQKPPIKVTSRWTFRCPGCPDALSAVSDHYEERDKCMAYFEQVYGYNPLRRTQFRADSILFKTRIPSTMTKCFQFV